jgi:hypothetical protein
MVARQKDRLYALYHAPCVRERPAAFSTRQDNPGWQCQRLQTAYPSATASDARED